MTILVFKYSGYTMMTPSWLATADGRCVELRYQDRVCRLLMPMEDFRSRIEESGKVCDLTDIQTWPLL